MSSRMVLFVVIAMWALLMCGFINSSDNSRFSGGGGYKPRPPGPDVKPSDDQIWKTFAKCKVKMDQDLSWSIVFTSAVTAMNGKKVSISGFMLPLESKEKFSHFLLGKNAPTCAFCPPGGPNEVVEVFSARPTVWKENLVTFTGTLVLVNDGKNGVFFQMKDAVER